MKAFFCFIFIFVVWFETKCQTNTMTDLRDGKVYKTVRIGSKIWLAQNLSYDPDTLSHRFNRRFEYGFGFFFSSEYCKQYGMLYSWKTALNVCPEGWHLPSKQEFELLLNHFGGNKKSQYDSLIARGVFSPRDFAGFASESALIITFHGLDVNGRFWTSTIARNWLVYDLSLHKKFKTVKILNDGKSDAVSVRCVKDVDD